jgi:uncharacterized cysteine cluster protein YcgN (CxxCxxCC family)
MPEVLEKADLCLRCGKCCYLTFYDPSGLYAPARTDKRCPSLNEKNLCDRYHDRPKWCMTAEKMKALGILPQGCGYLKGG